MEYTPFLLTNLPASSPPRDAICVCNLLHRTHTCGKLLMGRTATSHQQVDLGLETVHIVVVCTLVRGLPCELFGTQLHLLPANPQ